MAVNRKSGFRIRNAGAVLMLAGLLLLPPSIARAHGRDCRGDDDDDNQIAALAAQVAALQSQVNALQTQISSLSGLSSQVTQLQTIVNTLQTSVNGFGQQIQGLQNVASLGQYVSVNPNTVNGVQGPNLVFSGVNVQIVNGLNTTTTPNGLGNLIIGYNDDNGGDATIDANRGGSHNLIVGDLHQFSSAGGIVAGYSNQISSLYANVTGGSNNVAQAFAANVSGGDSNSAFGAQSTISGGHFNLVKSGAEATVSGGKSNIAEADYATVGGGVGNDANTQGQFLAGP